jgi:tetratricopeptide (TPR) repeat protein
LRRRRRNNPNDKAPAAVEAPPTPTPLRHRGNPLPSAATILTLLVALAAYGNSLSGDFVFDDFYAVVENRDVSPPPTPRHPGRQTTPMPPLRSLFAHDFWGQDMASEQSHKSYRPVTVLVFRWTAQLWRLGWRLGWWGGDDGDDSGAASLPTTTFSSPSVPPWLHPLPFHALAVLLHCTASALVFHVALWLLSKRRAPPRSSPPPHLPPTAAALAAALLFALHPVHTEAVAGIVGSAEALAAVFALAALRLYGSAAAAAANGDDEQHQNHHWPRVTAALLLALLSALSKETGATVLGSMALYDVLVALPPLPAANSRQRQRQLLRVLACFSTLALYVCLRAQVASSDGSSTSPGDHLVRIYRRVENPIAFEREADTRLFSALHLHALYAGLLVFPLRLSADWSFECVPMTPPPWRIEKGFSASFLHHHARWLALYGALAWVVAAARPLQLAAGLVRAWWRAVLVGVGPSSSFSSSSKKKKQADNDADDKQDDDNQTARRRWRLFVVLALIVAPFFPASNALFYVGTYIGERLLYLPSVGFCLLVADALFPADADAAAAPANKATATKTPPPPPPPPKTRILLILSLLLTLYAARTYARNMDWRDESALFASALRVCPRSAKALLNSGVLARRRTDGDEALRLFQRAREVDPTYCEVSYWVGLTLAERGVAEGVLVARAAGDDDDDEQQQRAQALERAARDVRRGMRELRQKGVRCKYVAVQSVEALNRLYVQLQQRPAAATTAPPLSQLLLGPQDGAPAALLASWAGVLADPAVSRAAEACAAYEDAALAVAVGTAAPFCRVAAEGKDDDDKGRSTWQQQRQRQRQRLPCVSSLLDRCQSALLRAERGEVAPDSLAEANLRRVVVVDDGDADKSDLSRRVARASGDAALLREGALRLKGCLALRRPVYLEMAGAAPSSSLAVKRAAYAYLLSLQGQERCRAAGAGGGGGGGAGEEEDEAAHPPTPSSSSFPPSPHQRLVHALQAADPEDPWLQAEWAETLLAVAAAAEGEGRGQREPSAAGAAATNSKTAAKHFEAAALLLLRHVAKGGGGALDPDPAGWPQRQQQEDDEAPALCPLPTALRSAARFLSRRLELLPVDSDRPEVRCALHQRLCHTHFYAASLEAAGEEEDDKDDEAAAERRAASARDGERCARDLERQPRCRKHAEELRQAVKFNS